MNKLFEEYNWNRIYTSYERKAKNISPDLLEPVDMQEIKFEYDGQYNIAGYDWIHILNFDKRIQFVTEKPTEFLLFGLSLNKGTLQTAQYLVGAKEDKELMAAVWLYSTLKEIEDYLPENWRGKGYRVLNGAERETASFLRNNDITWHHAMKALVPEIYFTYDILEKLVLEELDTLIELTVINSTLIKKNYRIVYYESYR